MAADTPVNPFGATRAGVLALVPEARLAIIPPGGTPPLGQTFAITEDQVDAWIAELTGAVALRLDGWQRLSDTPRPPEETSDRAQLVAFARTVVLNGAASYLEDARHPERSSENTTSYGTVLWNRHRTGLADLEEWLRRRLARPDGDDEADPSTSGGAAYAFPPTRVPDCLRF